MPSSATVVAFYRQWIVGEGVIARPASVLPPLGLFSRIRFARQAGTDRWGETNRYPSLR